MEEKEPSHNNYDDKDNSIWELLVLNKNLEQQLQEYKDREDKLIEYANNIKSSGINSHFDAPVIKDYILQILNKEERKTWVVGQMSISMIMEK